jgi:hypothetical protein
MSREKHRFSLPPPRGKRGGSRVAGVAAMQYHGGYFARGVSIL